MESLHEFFPEYRKQMERGAIRKAYQGLMEYILSLKANFKNKYPDYFVSGSLYPGYMDMTYFSFFPESLKRRKLKVAIVFIHERCRFEVWLAGYNKQVQTKYWEWFKESGWDKYSLVSTTQGADSILEGVLVDEPDFRDLDALTEQIEKGTLAFIRDVESVVSKF